MEMPDTNERRIIVSLTSYPARIQYVSTVLSTITAQTKQADEIVLWLAEEQFPEKEKNLPRDLRKMIQEGIVTLRWCDDLKPHKKYFYAFQEYPDDLIVTIDDDLYYPSDMIEKLYASYLKHPNAVSAMCVHLMVYDEKTGILPYNAWVMGYQEAEGIESMQLFHTGNAGVLYPVHLLQKNMLNKNAIREACLYADDIWLKMMEIVSNVPVVFVKGHSKLNYIRKTQENGLFPYNISHNDEQIQRSIHQVESRFGEGYVMDRLISAQKQMNLLNAGFLSNYYYEIIKKQRENLADILNSWSFRIGAAITFPGRMVKKEWNYIRDHLKQDGRKSVS